MTRETIQRSIGKTIEKHVGSITPDYSNSNYWKLAVKAETSNAAGVVRVWLECGHKVYKVKRDAKESFAKQFCMECQRAQSRSTVKLK